MLASWYAGVFSSAIKSEDLVNLISESLTCQTKSVKNSDEFVAFITDQGMASKLLSALCSNQTLNRQYGKVTVQWSHNEQEIIQYVGKGIADLALVKENVMLAFAAQTTYRYQTVAQYQDYSAYLISLKEKPELSKQYLWGKSLGLLDYPSSRSGHIVPKGLLNDLGISEANMDIIYVNSHEALRDLLAAGKVDIISSFWKDIDDQRFSANYITPIKTKVSGSKWYLKMETQNTDLICEIQKTLLQLSSKTQSDYYSQLQLIPNHCQLPLNAKIPVPDEK
ncbi:MAG: PhnD/SsuA/transferrin family substrate-binding protein [Paraglaciecola polaris]|uniref:PhnD/SsuA/transferrin family substrate-binding protein n=1 Tax=Paraglaciecola polaris TaxID=222814 RepID=UPI00300324C1|tara:strand:- start:956 stop:1795 length:840 start_codon:yes stop_codon:yes gene_type:complete